MSAAPPELSSTPAAAHAPPPRLLGSSRARALLVLGVLAVIVVFFFGGDGLLSILDITLIAALATLGLNVLSGYTGQISLGISFFMAIGAYTAAWLGGDPPAGPHDPVGLGLSFLIWLPAAGIVAALAGAVIGPTALRLKGFYLAIVTLALVFIGYYIFVNLPGVTGGPQGRSFPAPSFGSFSFASPDPIFGLQLDLDQMYFLLILVVLAISGLFVANVFRSRAGRALQAVRDNETGATIMGINLFQAKIGAFVLSSFLAGIAGALWASYPGFAQPSTWNLLLSIEFVAAMLIGGVASVWGSILGAGFVFALQQILQNTFPQSASATGISGGVVSAILYGALIIVFLLFEPAGIIGLIRRLQFAIRRFDERRRSAKGGDASTTLVLADPESPLDIENARVSRTADE